MAKRKVFVKDGLKYLVCTCCNELKQEDDFNIHTRALSGRDSICKVCQKYRMNNFI